jgi:hypothetical protein
MIASYIWSQLNVSPSGKGRLARGLRSFSFIPTDRIREKTHDLFVMRPSEGSSWAYSGLKDNCYF